MTMKRLLMIAVFAAAVVACKEPRSWCPVEVSVPILSADIPDTVEAGQKFTVDFVMYKCLCIKEYRVRPQLKKDTVYFFGEAVQDLCDEFPDTASVEKSVLLSLGDYERYTVIYNTIDTLSRIIGSSYDCIVVRKK